MKLTTRTRNTKLGFAAALLSLAVFLSVGCTSFAQGTVDFENFSNSLISTNSVHNGPATGLISGSGSQAYYFALLSAPTNHTTVDASLSGWAFQDYGINIATPGLMNGNYTTDPGVDVMFSNEGEYANFVVVGWSANIGNTWGDAKAWWNNGNPSFGPSGYFAISSIARDVVVGGALFPVPTIFGPTPGYEVQGFTLNYYPIPPPQITRVAVNGTNALVSFPAMWNYSYSVQSTTDLVSGSWSTIASNLIGTYVIVTNIDVGAVTVPKRFYRLRLSALLPSDNAADPVYNDFYPFWRNMEGGTGFGSWFLMASTNNASLDGFFIGSSTNNAAGTSPGIDTAGRSWGIYANSGSLAVAYRGPTEMSPAFLLPLVQVGQSFLISMDNGNIDAGGSVGFVLRNGDALNGPNDYIVGARFEFLYTGFDATNSYKVLDAGGQRNIGVPFTGTGLRLVFTLNTANTYTLLTIDNATGTTNTVTGTLSGSGPIESLALFNSNAGTGPSHDVFFNSLQVIGP
jgi:hypothetical protein